MINIVIFGAPGSGKGTQSEFIAQEFGLKHISTGDILRQEIADQTELGKLANQYMSKGQLVPDDVVIRMQEHLIAAHADQKGFIFDGFPRTIEQGKALDTMLAHHNEKVTVVLSLDVEDAELIDRLLKRGQISGRSDDNRETIENRLKVYYSQTEPLKEFYAKQGKLARIKGMGSIDEIKQEIAKTIRNAKH